MNNLPESELEQLLEMKRNTTLIDSRGNPIYEGDTLLFKNGGAGYLEQDIIDKFSVDKMIGNVECMRGFVDVLERLASQGSLINQ
ncbi:MAG: hypothetical protein ACJAYB_000085 [Psychromonas sp.]|jgi:hypothetical protein